MLYDDHLLQIFKDTLDRYSEHFLDQFVHALCEKTNIIMSSMLKCRCLHNRLDFTIIYAQEIELQRSEEDCEIFNSALLKIAEHPEMFLLVDETHKDMNASQRKWTWGQRGENLELSRWLGEYF